MDITHNPPKVGKAELLDRQFADWWLFLNSWGISAFLLFLASLGAGDYKYICAVLSLMLLGWGYWVGFNRFPKFIRQLRGRGSPDNKALEKEIFHDHFTKKILSFFPLFLGMGSLLILAIWPALGHNWSAYLTFLKP